MGIVFNPFTGTFDFTGGSGGGLTVDDAANRTLIRRHFNDIGGMSVNAPGGGSYINTPSRFGVYRARLGSSASRVSIREPAWTNLGAQLLRMRGRLAPNTTLVGCTDIWCGVGDQMSSGAASAGPTTSFVGAEYDPGLSANWRLICRDSGVTTVVDSGVLVALSTFFDFGFIYDGVTPSVQWLINEVAFGAPITTNIPNGTSLALQSGIRMLGAGNTIGIMADLFNISERI